MPVEVTQLLWAEPLLEAWTIRSQSLCPAPGWKTQVPTLANQVTQ